jgi:hypothetical protein
MAFHTTVYLPINYQVGIENHSYEIRNGMENEIGKNKTEKSAQKFCIQM